MLLIKEQIAGRTSLVEKREPASDSELWAS